MSDLCNDCIANGDDVEVKSGKLNVRKSFYKIDSGINDNEIIRYTHLQAPPREECLRCLKLINEEYCSSCDNPCMGCLYKREDIKL